MGLEVVGFGNYPWFCARIRLFANRPSSWRSDRVGDVKVGLVCGKSFDSLLELLDFTLLLFHGFYHDCDESVVVYR